MAAHFYQFCSNATSRYRETEGSNPIPALLLLGANSLTWPILFIDFAYQKSWSADKITGQIGHISLTWHDCYQMNRQYWCYAYFTYQLPNEENVITLLELWYFVLPTNF